MVFLAAEPEPARVPARSVSVGLLRAAAPVDRWLQAERAQVESRRRAPKDSSWTCPHPGGSSGLSTCRWHHHPDSTPLGPPLLRRQQRPPGPARIAWPPVPRRIWFDPKSQTHTSSRMLWKDRDRSQGIAPASALLPSAATPPAR